MGHVALLDTLRDGVTTGFWWSTLSSEEQPPPLASPSAG